MSSSFRRAKTRLPTETNARGCTNMKSNNNSPNIVQTVLKRRGTKPWVGGLTLTSTGLRELDAICGGGQPLGTAILVEEDRWTQDLGIALARYWAAEVSDNVLKRCSKLSYNDNCGINYYIYICNTFI